ncbi:MAG: class I SAM-dependent methyltransferase [Deltaproteobacteria bacterium]|nr:class I SAM-dependent methyltransferase [Deltaproteobacteria bacterium]
MITVKFDKLPIKAGHKILDIGCGSGRHICAASQFENVVSIGSDVSYDEVVEARNRLVNQEKLGQNGGGLWATLAADITNLPFPDDFFDMVICSEVLEHIPDQHTAVKEVTRVLRPGGDLIVSVPRYLPERICWALSQSYHQTTNGHIRIYKKKELIALLESSGSRLWASHFAHSLHTPYWWLKCLIGPTREDSTLVNLYHRFLVWDMMKKPWMTRFLDHLLNPLLGKSIVFYLRKEEHVRSPYFS